MMRLVLTAAFGLLFSFSYGQLKKFYSLKEISKFDTVDFSLDATAGNCYIKQSNEGPLAIYGNPDLEKINPSFKYEIINNTCKVALDLQEYRSSSFGDGLVLAMLREKTDDNNYWKVLFDDEKIYRLNLNYGFGNADVDLSGSSVSNFKVRTGSADINIDYREGEPNKIQMDTFWVKSDMGSIVTRHLELANAKYVMANVGFGNAILDFNKPGREGCTIEASVGAGNLKIIMPGKDVPMIIYLKDSPLCGVKLAEGFEEVERNVFVNMKYDAQSKDLMTFRVDVALGNIAFQYAD